MKKKILLALLAVAVMFVLAACQGGVINGELEITNTAGAGVKTYTVHLYKDGAYKLPPDDDKIIVKNGKHLPGGAPSVVEKLNSVCALEDAVIEIIETTDDYDVVSISFEFDSIDDYNAKMEILADGVADVEEAFLVADGGVVTFEESTDNFKNSIQWALDAVYNDPEVYDPKGGDPTASDVSKDDFASVHSYVIYIGESEGLVDYREDVEAYVTVEGTVDEVPVTTPEESEEETDVESTLPETETEPESTEPETAVETETDATETETAVETETDATETAAETETETETTPDTGDYNVLLFAVLMAIAGLTLVAVKKTVLNRK